MALKKSTIEYARFEPRDPRLGRHIVHDAMSLRYPFRATKKPRQLASVKHNINLGIMDQGQLGSCTGHAGTNMLAADKFWVQGKPLLGSVDVAHEYAVGLYSDATKQDPWPGQYTPDDTGSDGLSIAKVLLSRGLISGYQHAFTLEDALGALAQQPIMLGTSWLEGMFTPSSDGQLVVSGATAGGHEYILDELDVENQRAWMRNQWGANWGKSGRAWMTWVDIGKLLKDSGDVTILVPASQPVPQPEPPPPAVNVNQRLATSLKRFVPTPSCPAYLRNDAKAWLKTMS